jgi:hypothetical protein
VQPNGHSIDAAPDLRRVKKSITVQRHLHIRRIASIYQKYIHIMDSECPLSVMVTEGIEFLTRTGCLRIYIFMGNEYSTETAAARLYLLQRDTTEIAKPGCVSITTRPDGKHPILEVVMNTVDDAKAVDIWLRQSSYLLLRAKEDSDAWLRQCSKLLPLSLIGTVIYNELLQRGAAPLDQRTSSLTCRRSEIFRNVRETAAKWSINAV